MLIESTSAEYASSLASYLTWVGGADLAAAASKMHLFAAYLAVAPIESGARRGYPRSAGRINRILVAVRDFYRFAVAEDAVDADVLRHLYEVGPDSDRARVRHRRREPRRHDQSPDQATADEVMALLEQAELSAVRNAAGNTTAVESLDIVVSELATAQTEIVELVAGVPPAQLGSGRLQEALQALAQRSPIPVSVTVATDAASDQDTEAALFYVCSEALANAVKHADTKRIGITVRRVNGAIEAVLRRRARRRGPDRLRSAGTGRPAGNTERPAPGGYPTRSRHDSDSDGYG